MTTISATITKDTNGKRDSQFIIYETTISVTLLAIGISVMIVIVIGMCAGCVCMWRYRKSQNAIAKFNFFKTHNLMDVDRKKRSNYYNKAAANKKYVIIEQLKTRHIMMLCRHDQWEIDRKSLLVGNEKLGNGAFANVYKGTIVGALPIHRMSSIKLTDNHVVAVKMLPKHADATSKADFLNEMDFMKQLGYHPHIVSLLGCISDPHKPMLIVEYCSHGDMLQFLRKHRNSLLQVTQSNES